MRWCKAGCFSQERPCFVISRASSLGRVPACPHRLLQPLRLSASTDSGRSIPSDDGLDMSIDELPTERCLTLEDVQQRVARKKSWIYKQIRLGQFPAPDDGRWFESEINAYLRARRVGITTQRKPFVA
jgi:predicted DNA-binding transcriptional regulator AlpA